MPYARRARRTAHLATRRCPARPERCDADPVPGPPVAIRVDAQTAKEGEVFHFPPSVVHVNYVQVATPQNVPGSLTEGSVVTLGNVSGAKQSGRVWILSRDG